MLNAVECTLIGLVLTILLVVSCIGVFNADNTI